MMHDNRRSNDALRHIINGYIDLGFDIGTRNPLVIHRGNRMMEYRGGIFIDADIEHIFIDKLPEH